MRGPDTGTRVPLDAAVIDAGLDPDQLAGPELGSHLEVALAAGAVHAGLAVRAGAADLDLKFLPITWEDYDLVLPAAALGATTPLIDVVHDLAVREAVTALGGYDLSRAGTVVRLN